MGKRFRPELRRPHVVGFVPIQLSYNVLQSHCHVGPPKTVASCCCF